ncbi:MAG: histidine--tRNA ligase [Acidobacteriota bacterium]
MFCHPRRRSGLQNTGLPRKLFYIGPQFRYERPQKGRYRQFHQIGAELLGDAGPESDAEVVLMLTRFLIELGFEGLVVRLNTVGEAESRSNYRQELVAYLSPRSSELSKDSQRRLEDNPLRVLDSKSSQDREVLAGAPVLLDSLTTASRHHFERVQELLTRAGVAFVVDTHLVRGLDYYTRTVFEIVSEDLGAQDAIVGGGRYDDLVSSLGGPDLPAIGFAIGEDRLIELLPESFVSRARSQAPIFVVPVGAAPVGEALEVAESLRSGGLNVETELTGRSMKAALKRADRSGARWVLLIGDDEVDSGMVTIRDLGRGEQRQVARSEIVDHMEKLN